MNISAEQEIWKFVQGYEGIYEVSSCGRVRRYNRCIYANRNRSTNDLWMFDNAVVKQYVRKLRNGTTCLVVHLSKNGDQRTKTVSHIVAESFVPNPEQKKFVKHVDGDYTNNHASNLEWCSMQELNNK